MEQVDQTALVVLQAAMVLLVLAEYQVLMEPVEQMERAVLMELLVLQESTELVVLQV
jgi:hypothetical protein